MSDCTLLGELSKLPLRVVGCTLVYETHVDHLNGRIEISEPIMGINMYQNGLKEPIKFPMITNSLNEDLNVLVIKKIYNS